MRTQNCDNMGCLCPSGKKREYGSWMAKTLFPAVGKMWRGNIRSFLERAEIVDFFGPNSAREVEFQCLQPFSIPVQPSNSAWSSRPHQMLLYHQPLRNCASPQSSWSFLQKRTAKRRFWGHPGREERQRRLLSKVGEAWSHLQAEIRRRVSACFVLLY